MAHPGRADRKRGAAAASRCHALDASRREPNLDAIVARVAALQSQLTQTKGALRRERATRRRAETRLHDALESRALAERRAGLGHWRIDVARRTIRWSEGIARIFGRNEALDALSLDTHLGFYHPDDRDRVATHMRDASLGNSCLEGGGYEHVSRIVRPDGEIRIVSVIGIADHDQTGRPESLHGVCLDVTDVSRSEQSQRQAGETLRRTLEAMDQGLLMFGPDGSIRLHNRRAHDLLGLSDDELYDGVALPDDGPGRQPASAAMSEPCIRETRHGEAIIEIRDVPLDDGGLVRTLTDVTQRRATEQAVQESERRFRLLAETTTDIVMLSDLDTTRRYVSPAVRNVLGYEAEDLVGTRPLDFVHPDDVETYRAVLHRLTSGEVVEVVTSQRYRHRDGRWVWIEVSFRLTHDADGVPNGYVASLRDITDRKAAEDAMRLSEERLALALDSGSDGLWDWNLISGEIQFAGHWFRSLGYPPGEIESHIRSWADLIHPDDAESALEQMTQHLKGLTPIYECEYRVRSKAGHYAWTLARGKVVRRDEDGRAVRMVGTYIDITRRKEAERKIAHLAAHDALTDLPNRTLFRERLHQEIAGTERHGGSFAVLACDLDRFKAVNDTLGHPVGDALLRAVAERLRAVIREGDTVARLGGDEFAIIVARLETPQIASATAQRVIEAMAQPFDLAGQLTSIGVSIGIAIGPQNGADADRLFKNADFALYRAKSAGRNTYRFYEPEMDAAVAARTQLELDMREAVQRGGFLLHYQPIVATADGAIRGFEALMRWEHPSRGAISPAEFIPLAEETGLIVTLGTWALREACREATSWPGDLRVAVNISAIQFAQPGLEQSVVAALAGSGLAPNRLELEITESVLLRDAESGIACLHRLRALGIRIALDDFGTGYSSLSYLRRFPFDKIKIDRSFVREIADADAAAIVRAIVGLGERLAVTITAEGVETADQLERVRQEGCTEAQGFLFSKPVPGADALDFLLRGGSKRAA